MAHLIRRALLLIGHYIHLHLDRFEMHIDNLEHQLKHQSFDEAYRANSKSSVRATNPFKATDEIPF